MGVDVQPVTLATVADVMALLEDVATDLLRLENSVARGRALTSVATAAVRTIETSELEQRLSALESRMNDEKQS